jgi:hypothetical protein
MNESLSALSIKGRSGRAVPPNPSIERTPYGMLRMPSVAAHVERCASRLAREVLCRA